MRNPLVKSILAVAIVLSTGTFSAFAQRLAPSAGGEKTVNKADDRTARWAVSTNVADWGWYATPNVNAQWAVARHVSAEAEAKYNNWTFKDSSPTARNRQARQEYSLGARWWPWYVYSGWWAGAGAQYQEYSRRPMNHSDRKEEGDAYGVYVSGGYALQIKPWLNLDFGLGFWTGAKSYKLYQDSKQACPTCGKRIDKDDLDDSPSHKGFILPDELKISLMFVF